MKITTASLTFGRKGDDNYSIEIEDAHSHNNIMELRLSGKELALLITGLSGVKAECKIYEKANIAMRKEVKRVSMVSPESYDKKVVAGYVANDFAKYEKEGWQLWDDGTRSQQNEVGRHAYIICRYHPVDDPLKVERYY